MTTPGTTTYCPPHSDSTWVLYHRDSTGAYTALRYAKGRKPERFFVGTGGNLISALRDLETLAAQIEGC